MREAVTAVFVHRESKKIFTIERQNYLSVFPGYTAFPGGKVDKNEERLAALKREVQEELNFCLDDEQVLKVELFGIAVTPEFNPYRFKVLFYIVELSTPFEFDVDAGEAKSSSWKTPEELLEIYQNAGLLAVPPVISIIKALIDFDEIDILKERNFLLPHIEGREVPFIESIKGVRQFLPLSHTFPPANRTNAFIFGDEGEMKFLVDPSPKDKEEFEKLCRSVDKIGFDALFISHHHPDHHEFLGDFVQRYSKPVFMSEVTRMLIEKKWGKDYLKGHDLKIVKEGDILTKDRGLDLLIYEVPGHDEGQLALAPSDHAWIFVGDLIQTVGTVVIGGEEGDMSKYFASLQKMIDLKPRFILPSHGISIGGTHKLEMTLKHRLMREEQIKELMNLGKSEDEILSVVYEGLDERLVRYARKTIQAHIKRINQLK